MAENTRESRKEELRNRVIHTEEVQKEGRSRQRKGVKRYLLLLLLFLLLLFLGGVVHWFLNREFHSRQQGWSVTNQAEGSVQSDYEQYYPFADGLLRVTRDGAGYINSAGKTVWNQSFEMTEPYVSVNGSFTAIADQGKTAIYIMNSSGATGKAEASLPISKIAVSERGVVYALLEDREASFITVFTKEGGALDISIKSVLEGDGYPLDIAVSPDGTELICSFAYLEGGVLQNKIVFYNLSEVGQTVGNNRVVGGFTEDFKGYLTGRVRFSSDTAAQAFYNGGIAFFSTKVLTSPELLGKIEIGETIRSIAYSGSFVGVITEVSEEGVSEPYRLTVYKTNGQKLYELPFSFPYSQFILDNGRSILLHDTEMRIFDKKGKQRYAGALENPASYVKILSEDALGMSLMVSGSGSIENIKLR